MKWFKLRDTGQLPVTPVALPAKQYSHKMAESRETLHWFVKKRSNEISNKAYLEIREMEKVLENINTFLEDHKPTAADEHMIDSIMKDYLPSAIELFVKLPRAEKTLGGEGDLLLLKQCRTLAKDLRNRNKDLHDRATKELRTQAAFIDERFNDANSVQ